MDDQCVVVTTNNVSVTENRGTQARTRTTVKV